MAAVFHLMQSVAQLFSVALAHGFTCRGGIDVGVAAEFFDNELYGPALSAAYILESKVAKYPRIVIGTSLQEYLAAERPSLAENHALSPMMRQQFSQLCYHLMARDHE